MGDYAIISGLSAVHQFCRVGEHTMIAGLARVTKDVPPFMIIDGNPSATRGLNSIGLQRRGFSEDDIRCPQDRLQKTLSQKRPQLWALRSKSSESTKTLKTSLPSASSKFIETTERGVTR